MTKKRILVLGGNKFLGKNVIEQIKVKIPDSEITSITRSGVNDKDIQSIVCDRTNKDDLNEKVRGEFDVVFDVSSYDLATLKPSLELLKNRVDTWAFVSSAGVYDKSDVFPLQTHFRKVSQSSPHYGKFACEEALRNTPNLHTFCIRPFYIYGPENTFDRETFFFRAIEKEQEILIPDDGNALLQFASVKDTASIFVDLALKPKENTNKQVFHPCDKTIYSINSLIRVCGEVVNKAPKISYFSVKKAKNQGIPSRDIFPLRAENYFGDIESLNSLGLKTSDDLNTGISLTYQWFERNRDLYPSYTMMPQAEKYLMKI
ncbi:MAG: NAD-dependent epimerase/dehydratase family protein [Candidatus Caenarcaniphilales bacterium]|nr:NAD-dependent epimerase/dehydratase family protein [Candidatus Caenarcaniphilales bacterium]